ncbi:MAG: hypothetical protein CL484_14245 [Acidobacteria bacterium]|jgi:hypothetical protein|uniref:hypothetical protein n=1 Tax=Halomonas sp. PA16-9 TaxID=2576841 RepID=UPI000C93EAEC|nr:hypothetical protein [Acidobacteriota bacterium]QGQ72600.1 hypothetical protein FDY98_25670 [Halomonas sp. PA16-9]|tara:strand:+ start:6176 stop:6373 length:198 start_codon:yes stop_codon:yes gene_type:complete
MEQKPTPSLRALLAHQRHRKADEHPLFPRRDWKLERDNGDTSLSYWEWVERVRQETGNLRLHAFQ